PSIHAPLGEEDAKTEKILIENFVALQKVMTHLSEKFDNLTTQISKMLNLFEISAKALAEKEFDVEKENKDIKKTIEKLDNLLEQNKTIAKGLVLLHDQISPEKEEKEEKRQEVRVFVPNPVPTPISSKERFPPHERYQKSISSGESDFSPEPPRLPPKFKPLPK
ncbi:MAG: hypothetical protein ABIH28_01970, partial [archaeon]